MRYYEIMETPSAYLYHSVKYTEWAWDNIAVRNSILGTSTQRWWEDGIQHHDDEEIYQKSYWMKGISLTRSFSYAKSWGSVVLCLDQNKLKQNYKIIPFDWGNTITPRRRMRFAGQDFKREYEEYLILDKSKNTYIRPDDGIFDVNEFKKPSEKSLTDLDKYLIWFKIDNKSKDDSYAKKLAELPKFSDYF